MGGSGGSLREAGLGRSAGGRRRGGAGGGGRRGVRRRVSGSRDGGLGLRVRGGEGAAAALKLAEEGVALVGEAGEAGGEELEDAGVGEEVVEGALEVEVWVVGEAVGEGQGVVGGELAVEDAGFDGVVAELAPFEGGELAEEVGLVGVAGLEAVEEGGEEGFKLGGVLGGEEGGEAGVAAVLEGVEGRAGLAFRGLGAAAAAGIGVGGIGHGVTSARDCRGEFRIFRGGFLRAAGKWFGMRGIGMAKKCGRGVMGGTEGSVGLACGGRCGGGRRGAEGREAAQRRFGGAAGKGGAGLAPESG